MSWSGGVECSGRSRERLFCCIRTQGHIWKSRHMGSKLSRMSIGKDAMMINACRSCQGLRLLVSLDVRSYLLIILSMLTTTTAYITHYNITSNCTLLDQITVPRGSNIVKHRHGHIRLPPPRAPLHDHRTSTTLITTNLACSRLKKSIQYSLQQSCPPYRHNIALPADQCLLLRRIPAATTR